MINFSSTFRRNCDCEQNLKSKAISDKGLHIKDSDIET